MKWTKPFVALAMLSGLAMAEPVDLRRAPRIAGDAAAGAGKVAVCVACHGPEGNAVVPAFPALAGQRAGYLYQSLQGFQRRNDPASPMTAQVKDLGDTDLHNIAAYFASRSRSVTLDPTDAGSAGAILFRSGDPTRGIPACQGCHGDAAQGHPLRDATARYDYYPVLAGQHADYLVARMTRYRDGTPADTSNASIMHGVTHALDDASIRALANWLSATAH